MIREYIENHREKIINDLLELVRIPSVSDTPECDKMLDYVCDIYEKNDFETEKYEDYALAFYGNGEKSIGLYAHGDVVPAADDWIHSSAFEPIISDGIAYGRGISDNKAAIVASLYALKMINELNIPIKSRLVCFTGANEESSMNDIRNYLKSHTPPDFSFVLDAGFPLYLGDKGILWLDCKQKRTLSALKSFSGGSAVNIIIGNASATLKYSPRLYDELKSHSELEVFLDNGEIIIEAQGLSAHGATPNGTKNAAGIILNALMECSDFPAEDKALLEFPCELLNHYDGKALGIMGSDSVYGDNTVTNGIVRIEDGRFSYTLDIRYGTAFSRKQILQRVESLLAEHSTEYSIIKDGEPKVTDKDSPYVKACMKAFGDFTGNYEAQPRVNAGGTYSRYLPNAIEIGTSIGHKRPNLPAGRGGAHQSDEYISVEGMLDALELIINMITEVDRINNA